MLERVSQFVFSGKCLVQVNQVSITKACFFFERRKRSVTLGKALSRNRQNCFALCHADLRQDVDSQDSYV